MPVPVQGSILILLFLLARVLGVFLHRWIRCSTARRQSRAFRCGEFEFLRSGNLEDARAFTAHNDRGHIARVALAGLDYFDAAPVGTTTIEAVQFILGGMRRTAARVHREMQPGLDTLATTVVAAPFVGIFGTIAGIVYSSPGGSFTPGLWISTIATGLALALLTTAAGLFIGILASLCFKYFAEEGERMGVEMASVSLKLANIFSLRLAGRDTSPSSTQAG